MTIWSPDLKAASGPRYLALADALTADATAGRLPPGTRLPTHRALAEQLGVTVGTVTRAYGEAARRGVVSGEVGRGTFVRLLVPNPEEPLGNVGGGLVDLSVNYPPLHADDERAPELSSLLARLSRRRDLGALMRYPPEGGASHHRAAGASWLRRRGLAAEADDILVSSGGQHAMTAVFGGLLRPGDLVVTEGLTYPGLKSLASLMHLRVAGLALDRHGLRPEAFEAACRRGGVKALYCVPTLHNPTSAVMPEERRRAIAAIARAHDVLIVEDDVHGPLLDKGPRPLATRAPERSVYLTGLAKTVAPGLRVGFIHAPKALLPRIARAIRATTWMAAPLMAEIAASWIKDGTAAAWLKRHRSEAALRQRLAARVLGDAALQSHPLSYYAWLQLPESWRSESFAAEARRGGVAVTPASVFQVGKAGAEGVRVCLGPARDHAQLETALGVLAALARRTEAPAAFAAGP